MKIKSTITLSAFLIAIIPSFCLAAELNTSGPGEKISVTATNVTGTPTFEFQPSTNVVIDSTSTASSYSIAAWHNSSLDTPKGEAYGMASNVSGIYTFPLEDVTDPPTVGGTGDSTDFGTGWEAPLGSGNG